MDINIIGLILIMPILVSILRWYNEAVLLFLAQIRKKKAQQLAIIVTIPQTFLFIVTELIKSNLIKI